jgi:hypothetical protein
VMLSIKNRNTGRRYWSWDEALGWESRGEFEERDIWSDEKINVTKDFGGVIRVKVERFGVTEDEKMFFSQEEAKQYLRWRGWR